jgi:hypothetical protein
VSEDGAIGDAARAEKVEVGATDAAIDDAEDGLAAGGLRVGEIFDREPALAKDCCFHDTS